MTRIFQNKPFKRFADKEGLKNNELQKAIDDAEQGLIDADLGGGVIKQRIACHNKGKSSGYRTIVILKKAIARFLFMVLLKTIKRILIMRN